MASTEASSAVMAACAALAAAHRARGPACSTEARAERLGLDGGGELYASKGKEEAEKEASARKRKGLAPSLLFNGSGRSCAADLLRTISAFIGGNRRVIGHIMGHKVVTAQTIRGSGHDLRRRAVSVVKAHSSACASMTRVACVPWTCPLGRKIQGDSQGCSATYQKPRYGGDEEIFCMSEQD